MGYSIASHDGDNCEHKHAAGIVYVKQAWLLGETVSLLCRHSQLLLPGRALLLVLYAV